MKTDAVWFSKKDLGDFTQKTKDFFVEHESRYVQVFSLLEERAQSFSALVLMEGDTCLGFAFFDGKSTLYISDVSIEKIDSLSLQSVIQSWEYTRLAASSDIS